MGINIKETINMKRNLFTAILTCCMTLCFCVTSKTADDLKTDVELFQGDVSKMVFYLEKLDGSEGNIKENYFYQDIKKWEDEGYNLDSLTSQSVSYKRKEFELVSGVELKQRITKEQFLEIISTANTFSEIIESIEEIHGPCDVYNMADLSDWKEYWLNDEGTSYFRVFEGRFNDILYFDLLNDEWDCGKNMQTYFHY